MASDSEIIFQPIDHGSDRYREMLEIRDRILRAPLGLDFNDDEIAAESSDLHLAGIDTETGELVACLVLSPKSPELVHLRQVAVVENRRGLGIGAALSEFAEKFSAERGFREIKLHAREPVVGFYEKLGYAVRGEPFVEVTIPHREMRKRIAPD